MAVPPRHFPSSALGHLLPPGDSAPHPPLGRRWPPQSRTSKIEVHCPEDSVHGQPRSSMLQAQWAWRAESQWLRDKVSGSHVLTFRPLQPVTCLQGLAQWERKTKSHVTAQHPHLPRQVASTGERAGWGVVCSPGRSTVSWGRPGASIRGLPLSEGKTLRTSLPVMCFVLTRKLFLKTCSRGY